GQAAHLYVAVSPANNPNEVSVKRFPLVNGIPQSKADRVYRGHGKLIAVSSDGTLYAADPTINPLTVYAFDDGRTKADRTIEVSYPRSCGTFSSRLTEVNALAADRQGNLFVGILTYDQDAHRSYSAAPAARVPCNGVAIYAPGAKGRPKPI